MLPAMMAAGAASGGSGGGSMSGKDSGDAAASAATRVTVGGMTFTNGVTGTQANVTTWALIAGLALVAIVGLKKR